MPLSETKHMSSSAKEVPLFNPYVVSDNKFDVACAHKEPALCIHELSQYMHRSNGIQNKQPCAIFKIKKSRIFHS